MHAKRLVLAAILAVTFGSLAAASVAVDRFRWSPLDLVDIGRCGTGMPFRLESVTFVPS